MPAFYRQHPGAVLSTTIDKYIFISANPKFDGTIRLSYAKTENVTSVEELSHELVKSAMKHLGLERGVEMVSIADVPGKGTGLGSSSTFTVGLLHALDQYRKLWLGDEFERPTEYAHWLAETAFSVEVHNGSKIMGKQDQYAAAYGGFNFFVFSDQGVEVERLMLDPDMLVELERHLLLLFTGTARSSQDVLPQQQASTMANKSTFANLKEMTAIARRLSTELIRGNFYEVGEALHNNWLLKRELVDGISNEQINSWYQTALLNGATGGKVLGAGGGGFLLFFASPEKHAAIVAATGLRPVDFGFEKEGSKVIYMAGLDD